MKQVVSSAVKTSAVEQVVGSASGVSISARAGIEFDVYPSIGMSPSLNGPNTSSPQYNRSAV